MILTSILLFYTLKIVIDAPKIEVSEGDYVSGGDYYYNDDVFDNDNSYDLQNETKIEVSDEDYYYNDARDSYNAVNDLPEIETEIEI